MNLSIEKVKDSYGRCLDSEDFIGRFYEIFLEKDAEIKAKFVNTNFDGQKKLLRHAILSMILFAGDGLAGIVTLEKIRETHDPKHMDIRPWQYAFWKDSLLQTVEEKDPKFDEETKQAWSYVIDTGVKFITTY